MSVETVKLTVMQKLMMIKEESFLNQINDLIDSTAIVAYTVTGEPMTLLEYNRNLEEGEAQIARGEFTTQEDLEKEVENW
jgi:hypothetical protein